MMRKKANSLYTLNNSWCEGVVFDELYQEGRGVSGVLTFQLANEKNLEVFKIDNVAYLEKLKSQGAFDYICRDKKGVILYHDLYQEAYRAIKEYLKQGKQVKLVSKLGTETPKLQVDDYDGIAFIVEDVNLGVRAAAVCGGINQAKLGKGAVYCRAFLPVEVLAWFTEVAKKKIKEIEYINNLFETLRQVVVSKNLTNEIFDNILFPFAQEKKIRVKFKEFDVEGRYMSHLAAYVTFWLDWALPSIRSWFYGKGTIDLNKNLIETMPRGYVAGVLAHELFHAYDDLQRGPRPLPWTATIEEEAAAYDVMVYIWDELDVNNNIKRTYYLDGKKCILTITQFCEMWNSWTKDKKEGKKKKIKFLRDNYKTYRKLPHEEKDYWWEKYEK